MKLSPVPTSWHRESAPTHSQWRSSGNENSLLFSGFLVRLQLDLVELEHASCQVVPHVASSYPKVQLRTPCTQLPPMQRVSQRNASRIRARFRCGFPQRVLYVYGSILGLSWMEQLKLQWGWEPNSQGPPPPCRSDLGGAKGLPPWPGMHDALTRRLGEPTADAAQRHEQLGPRLLPQSLHSGRARDWTRNDRRGKSKWSCLDLTYLLHCTVAYPMAL